ncbi:hypothetical protein ABE473_03805 [Stenotrophomonas sp. TWI700]|uniref:hypothetical protein n=1 Tax=Stenotrophomonas sp. TWI700 TaxID=3136792 RepID=UPI00320A5988
MTSIPPDVQHAAATIDIVAAVVFDAGHRVRADAYRVTVTGTPRAQAEIAELAWVPLRPPHGVRLAPLSADPILPAAANAVAAT